MNPEQDYIEINRKLWNAKTEVHVKSEFYNNKSFIEGRSSLKKIETELLGNVKDKSILHLQCHFGQDTLSLARMGAKVTGVDFSDAAINEAKKLCESIETKADFICCDIYDLPNRLTKKFDMVFISYGAIGWLPDLNKWAEVISNFLIEGGKLIFVEFHPFIWMFDTGFNEIEYSYFNNNPIIENIEGTYADFDSDIKNESVSWNHPLSEVFKSLLNSGLKITHFDEYNFSPYNCFLNLEKIEEEKYRLKNFGEKIPMLYSLVCEKHQEDRFMKDREKPRE